MRIQAKRRDGKVAVLVALTLTALVSITAIAVDGGLLQDERGRAQAAADTAAMAAAEDLYANFKTHTGTDPSNTGAISATTNAAANGYANNSVVTVTNATGATTTSTGYANGVSGTVRSVVTVNLPPLTGPYAGLAGYVEVIIQYNQPRAFSNIFGSGDIPVKARAVARGIWATASNGVLALDPGVNTPSLNASGSTAAVNLIGAPFIVDSNQAGAMEVNGSGAILTAPAFNIYGVPGYVQIGGGQIVGTINSGVLPTPDPLSYLPEPDPSTMTVQATKASQSHYAGNKSVTLNPGVYIGGITATGGASLTLNPGIYYMEGGGFSFAGSGSLTGTGVMIYNDPASKSDTISINGNGVVNLTAPTSGLYQGIAIFQDRTSTTPIYVTGNGSMSMLGTFYAAAATLNVTGNGTNTIGGQYISYDVTIVGNGTLNINYNASPHPSRRILGLVE